MRLDFQSVLRLLAVTTVMLSVPLLTGADAVRGLEWDDLMPDDWDPFAKLDAMLSGESDIEDGSEEADRIMREFVTAGRNAPVVAALDGERVRLPGYVVPLDFEGTGLSEFLLVPYFGACIHVPRRRPIRSCTSRPLPPTRARDCSRRCG